MASLMLLKENIKLSMEQLCADWKFEWEGLQWLVWGAEKKQKTGSVPKSEA